MKYLVILLCAAAIVAALADVRCSALAPAPRTILIVCRAGRLP